MIKGTSFNLHTVLRQVCCAPDCDVKSEPDFRLPLCSFHAIQVIRDYHLLVAKRQAEPETEPAAAPEVPAEPTLAELRAENSSRKLYELRLRTDEVNRKALTQVDREWVYFLAFGNRVKIGYTTNLGSRLASLPFDKVLAVIPGNRDDERRLHRQFHHLRVVREWFQAEPELLEFIDSLGYTQAPEAERALRPDRRTRMRFPVTVTKIEAQCP